MVFLRPLDRCCKGRFRVGQIFVGNLGFVFVWEIRRQLVLSMFVVGAAALGSM
jgi:hypothetical protein